MIVQQEMHTEEVRKLESILLSGKRRATPLVTDNRIYAKGYKQRTVERMVEVVGSGCGEQESEQGEAD